MRTRHHPWLTFAIFCVMLVSASSVNAQAWLSDRKRAEGTGIRVGDLELHPGVGSEVGYYTNPFYSENPSGSASMRISPHLFLSTLGAERSGVDQGTYRPGLVRFIGGLAASYQHNFAFVPRNTLGTDLNLDFTLAPDRPVGLRITEVLSRWDLPFSDSNLPPAQRNTAGVDFTHYSETAGAQLLFQTSGGILKGSVGYRFGYAWFDDVGFRVNNNLTHGANLNVSWEFLPKTALFYDANYTHQDYTKNGDAEFTTTSFTRLVDNDQVNTRIGVNGAITSRLGATVHVGYAAGFFGGNDYEGLIAGLEGRFTPSEISEVALGADRGFIPSYQGGFQERNRIYGRLRLLLGRAFLIGSRLGVEFLDFGRDAVQGGRKDRRYFGELSAEYRFISWLAVTGQVNMLIDDTDFVYQPPVGATGVAALPNPARFKAFEGWVGLRAFY
jgi:hypothetical protein